MALNQSEVQEYLDGVKFSNNKRKDMTIAEEIAAMSFDTIRDLALRCRDEADTNCAKDIVIPD